MLQSFKKVVKGLSVMVCTLMLGLAIGLVVPIDNASMGSTNVVHAAASVTKSITMTQGKTAKIKISGAKGKVTYKTGNKKIAKVTNKGVVTGVAKGKTTIKVKVGGKSYKVSVTVEKPSISKSSLSLKKGNTYRLKVNGTSRKVKWSSNNKAVATVNSNGKITAKGKGQAIITAKISDKKFSCKVKVGGYNVIVCPDSITVRYGETKKVTMTAGDSFSYKLENYNLASVSINPTYFKVGEKLTMTVTGKAVGTTYIVFKSEEGWTKKCKLTVTGTSVPASTVSNTISSAKVNSIRAYRSCNTSTPELYVESSITNNMNAALNDIEVTYGLFDKNGKLITEVSKYIYDPVKGKTYSASGTISNSSYVNVNNVASIKIIDITGSLKDSCKGQVNPNINATVSTNVAAKGVTVSNINAKFLYKYYYNKTTAMISCSVKNTTSEGKLIKVYYDVYDANGNKVSQGDYCYTSKFIAAGQTVTVSTGEYGEDLVGALSTGTFSKVVLRVVEY